LRRRRLGRTRSSGHRSIPAGSAIDIVARVVLDPLSAQLGQQIVIDNRGGAGER